MAETFYLAASKQQPNNDGMTNGGVESVPDFARLSHHPSAVAMACSLANLNLLTLLIDKGASVDLADEDGETAMTLAIRNGFSEGVRVLIERGHANVNLAEKVNGWTPLIVAGKCLVMIGSRGGV